MKTHLNITIDTNIYLKIKLNPKINMSNLVNEFLKSYFNDEEIKVEELSSQLADHKKKGILLEYEITKKKAESEEKQQKLLVEKEEKRIKDIRSIPVGSDFYSKLAREKKLKELTEGEKDDTAHGRDL
jgi:hypothetical protein